MHGIVKHYTSVSQRNSGSRIWIGWERFGLRGLGEVVGFEVSIKGHDGYERGALFVHRGGGESHHAAIYGKNPELFAGNAGFLK